NELVWNYVVGNYLKGEPPPAFDLLHWNADGTTLPGPFFAWYSRNTYLETNLNHPGRVQVDGHPLDLSTLSMPAYIYSSREDHIVPWRSAYARSEEHTSELQSRENLVCRLLLEKKKHAVEVPDPTAPT